MKASPTKRPGHRHGVDRPPREQATSDEGIDIPLLEESLAKTVWERMLANDDALRLAELLQAAVLKSRAKPK